MSVRPSTQIQGMGELRGRWIWDHLAIGGQQERGSCLLSSPGTGSSPEAWELGDAGCLIAQPRALTAR